ncbi:SDR family oxidoreductase [Oscillatoria sp. FACHB-1407]|uniref:SDR family oxidoreductase n=1 Tax=Oscillatoria sp. FACHB-1407 TaxID=2692847 RepID=UPI001684E7A6|nr:SDR family oxidoreductase [Oscillatoria sp. FACHB-1407]MBD2463135.1 SDR family oxidoreductase [Oscillatoria sp. FACHB-1407]
MRAVLITGASSGIGYGAAKEFVSQGYHVFGSVRQDRDAQQLSHEMGTNFVPLCFDVTDANAIQQAADKVASMLEGKGLAGLINNAGIATSGPLIHQPLDEIRWQFEVNVIGLIAVTQAFLPLLKAQTSRANPGRIINISSTGGKIAAPFIGAYAGSKHAVEGISHSLRRELQLHGIDVIIVAPGAVNTPIWDKESAQDVSRYTATEYAESIRAFQQYFVAQGKQGYSSEVVGRFIRRVFETPNPKSRYTIVRNPISNWILPALLPDRWLDKLIGRNVGLLPK